MANSRLNKNIDSAYFKFHDDDNVAKSASAWTKAKQFQKNTFPRRKEAKPVWSDYSWLHLEIKLNTVIYLFHYFLKSQLEYLDVTDAFYNFSLCICMQNPAI